MQHFQCRTPCTYLNNQAYGRTSCFLHDKFAVQSWGRSNVERAIHCKSGKIKIVPTSIDFVEALPRARERDFPSAVETKEQKRLWISDSLKKWENTVVRQKRAREETETSAVGYEDRQTGRLSCRQNCEAQAPAARTKQANKRAGTLPSSGREWMTTV